MSCDEEFFSGQEIPIYFETRVDGVNTDPAALRFKWRSPTDTATTTWTWNTDVQIVRDSVGLFHVDVQPDTLRPGADSGLWKWRWEADGIETAQEGQFRVKPKNV